MDNKNINTTKARLSALFALVVFLISILLIGIFLTYKYAVSVRKDKNEFLFAGREIAKSISNREDFLNSLRERRLDYSSRSNDKKRANQTITPPLLFTNFIVADEATDSILFWNINKNFDIESLIGADLEDGFSIEDSVMIETIALDNLFKGKTLITFNEIKYTKTEYFLDFLTLFVISLISSVGFYFIGYMFVSRNLKPVEENIKDMQNFIHNAGHELKTPLAVIHSNLQLLWSIKKYDKELTKDSLNEINKLNQLIEWLVELSDIGKDHETENLHISELIEEILSDFSTKSKGKKIDVVFQAQKNVFLGANRQYFYIFFSNIFGNAIKYNKKWGSIKINLTKQGFSVIDTGIWIEQEKIPKIFDRFFKAETARNQDGYGIWLSLVKKIANIYGWKIKVESQEKKGTQFYVHF